MTLNIVPLPIVAADAYNVTEDNSLNVAAPGVLQNDTDVSGPVDLQAVVVDTVEDGTLTLNADGSFTYEPFPNFSGMDTFIYKAVDAVTGGLAEGLVVITVDAVNDAPIARDDSFVTEFETQLDGDVLANDTDPDDDIMSVALVQSTTNGSLNLQSDGSFSYVPNADFDGSDSFTYRANDGTLDSVIATVNIAVTPDGLIDPDLLAHLLFDDGTDPATDSSGSGNSAALLGPVYVNEAGDSTASSLSFDGIEDTADLGAFDVNGTGLSLAAWFNATTFPGAANDPRIISKASGSAINDHTFMLSTIEANGDIRLRMRVKINGQTRTLRATSGNLVAGQWYHAAATYDGSTMRLFLDGVEVGNLGFVGTVDQEPAVSVAVGSQPGGGNNFHGLIDDVRIMQRALTINEIENIASGSATADPIPTQPGDLTGFALSQSRVDLNWTASTDNFWCGCI